MQLSYYETPKVDPKPHWLGIGNSPTKLTLTRCGPGHSGTAGSIRGWCRGPVREGGARLQKKPERSRVAEDVSAAMGFQEEPSLPWDGISERTIVAENLPRTFSDSRRPAFANRPLWTSLMRNSGLQSDHRTAFRITCSTHTISGASALSCRASSSRNSTDRRAGPCYRNSEQPPRSAYRNTVLGDGSGGNYALTSIERSRSRTLNPAAPSANTSYPTSRTDQSDFTSSSYTYGANNC